MRRARRVRAAGLSSANLAADFSAAVFLAVGTPHSVRGPPDDACGTMGAAMIGFLVILFPFVLLGFVLFMERVEEPLNQVAVEREMEEFLDSASADELDTFVREGA